MHSLHLPAATRALSKPCWRAWRALGLALLSLGLLAGAAQASVVRFNFEVDFSSGPLGGQSAFGSFDIDGADCPALVCNGSFTPSGAANPIVGPTGTLLAFNVFVDGITFAASADDGFPDFPSITLDANALARIDFADFSGPPSLTLFGSALGGWGGEYRDANFDGSTVTDIRLLGAPALIPEPGTAALLACGLVALVATSRRRRAA